LWAVLAASGVLVLVLACGALALVPRRAPVAIATRQEVEQRAVQMAQDVYDGMVTNVAVRATTQGEVNPQRCSFRERVEQQLSMLQNAEQWPWCDDNLPMWEATVQGTFCDANAGGTTPELHIIFTVDGSPSLTSGAPCK